MTDQPQKPGEQLAIEALASAGLTFRTLAAATGDLQGAEKIHNAMEWLCALPATQQRSDALRAIVKAMEAIGVAGDPLLTPGFLIGDAWLEEFEGLGGTCRIVPDHDKSEQAIVVLKTEIPAQTEPAERAKLVELRRRLGENDLSRHVIVCILSRSSWDDLHGPIA